MGVEAARELAIEPADQAPAAPLHNPGHRRGSDVTQGPLRAGSHGRSGGSIIVSVAGSVRLTPSGLFLTLKPCRRQKTTKLNNPIASRITIKVSNDMAQSSPRWRTRARDCLRKSNTVRKTLCETP